MIWQMAWSTVLLTAVAFDIGQRRIPNWLTTAGMLVALGLAAGRGGEALLAAAGGGVLALAFFGMAYLLGRLWGRRIGQDALGLGDVKLAILIGVVLGWPLAAPALFLSVLAGGLAALAMMLWHLVKDGYRPGITMPYGPALVLGGLIGLWAGAWLLNLWLAAGG